MECSVNIHDYAPLLPMAMVPGTIGGTCRICAAGQGVCLSLSWRVGVVPGLLTLFGFKKERNRIL